MNCPQGWPLPLSLMDTQCHEDPSMTYRSPLFWSGGSVVGLTGRPSAPKERALALHPWGHLLFEDKKQPAAPDQGAWWLI